MVSGIGSGMAGSGVFILRGLRGAADFFGAAFFGAGAFFTAVAFLAAVAFLGAAFLAVVAFFGVAFFTAAFLGAAFLAVVAFFGAAFFTAAFLGAAFLAVVAFFGAAFLAAGFFTAAFLAAGFLVVAFLAAGFLAGAFAVVFFAVVFMASGCALIVVVSSVVTRMLLRFMVGEVGLFDAQLSLFAVVTVSDRPSYSRAMPLDRYGFDSVATRIAPRTQESLFRFHDIAVNKNSGISAFPIIFFWSRDVCARNDDRDRRIIAILTPSTSQNLHCRSATKAARQRNEVHATHAAKISLHTAAVNLSA